MKLDAPPFAFRRTGRNMYLLFYSYSTVTLLAKFLGWSTSQPRRTAMW